MKTIFDFIVKNPIAKTIGIGLILYYALFANTEKPNSLGNRINKETLSKDIKQAQEKIGFIATNVKVARNLSNPKNKRAAQKIQTIDEKEGIGENIVECEDEVKFSGQIFSQDGRLIKKMPGQIVVIGSKSNSLIEKNILGMKELGVRIIAIPYNSTIKNREIAELMSNYSTSLEYKITVKSIEKSLDQSTKNCY